MQAAFRQQGINPSAAKLYPAVDMEKAIEAWTGVGGSATVHCKRDEVDKVRQLALR